MDDEDDLDDEDDDVEEDGLSHALDAAAGSGEFDPQTVAAIQQRQAQAYRLQVRRARARTVDDVLRTASGAHAEVHRLLTTVNNTVTKTQEMLQSSTDTAIEVNRKLSAANLAVASHLAEAGERLASLQQRPPGKSNAEVAGDTMQVALKTVGGPLLQMFLGKVAGLVPPDMMPPPGGAAPRRPRGGRGGPGSAPPPSGASPASPPPPPPPSAGADPEGGEAEDDPIADRTAAVATLFPELDEEHRKMLVVLFGEDDIRGEVAGTIVENLKDIMLRHLQDEDSGAG